MNLSDTTIPDSTQWNAEDFLDGPRTFTITDVVAGNAEQPVNIALEGSDRTYRPSKSMRRVLVAAWGAEGNAYTGRRLTLYRDPDVKFGRDTPGGIKISHLSHITKPMVLALTITRGKRAPHTVQPLPTVAPTTDSDAGSKQRLAALGAAFTTAGITDRTDRLVWASKAAGRDVTSASDLTPAECAAVVASLTDDASGEEWPDVAEPGSGGA